MMDVIIAFFFGFCMGGGLLGLTLKSICGEDKNDEKDETEY